MFYLVEYRTPKGDLVSVSVDAESEDEAKQLSGQPSNRIVAVKRDTFAQIKRALLYPTPPRAEQALFLQNLASLLLSGEDITKSIKRLLVGNRSFRYRKDELSACITAVDYLRALHFSDLAITMAEVGERSGNLGNALQTAASDMMEMEDILKDLTRGLWQALVYILIAMVLLIGFPLIIHDTLVDIVAGTEGQLKTTFWTDYLIAVYHIVTHYWGVALLVILLCVTFREQVWQSISGIPGISLINDYLLLRRSILFLLVYRSLYRSGIPDTRCMMLLKSQSRGRTAKIYESMYRTLRSGKDLGKAINTDDWPDTLRFSLSNFGAMTDDKKMVLIETLLANMRNQIENTSRKITKLVATLSMICIIIGIVAVALGFYMPVITMRPS